MALAHALRHGGLDVAVYERDPSPRPRNQGYRIHIDRDGNAALAACLPPEVLDVVRRTSGTTRAPTPMIGCLVRDRPHTAVHAPIR